MTRVNVGIDPIELCDQHLVAEYRELPRCFACRRDAGPEQFKLNKGHMLWCARYPGSLAARFKAIVEEMNFRDIHVSFPDPPADTLNGLQWSDFDTAMARPILIERIKERLTKMKPRWKKRSKPDWV